LASQYVSQVTKDLEENVREQERVTAEIAALQERLAALQHDHAILLNMQQALGIAAPAPAPTPVVPAPRGKSGGARRADTKKPGPKKPAAKKPAARKPAARKPAAKKAPAKPAQPEPAQPAQQQPAQPTQPTLVELVRRYLTEQNEPRSAAEVAEALGRTYPERAVQTKVVRTTLENLVARNGAHRSKQGSSVFYTVAAEPAPETAEKAEGADPAE
jgi:hypothetical protein